jgi:hypothetical protein
MMSEQCHLVSCETHTLLEAVQELFLIGLSVPMQMMVRSQSTTACMSNSRCHDAHGNKHLSLMYVRTRYATDNLFSIGPQFNNWQALFLSSSALFSCFVSQVGSANLHALCCCTHTDMTDIVSGCAGRSSPLLSVSCGAVMIMPDTHSVISHQQYH